MMYNKLVQDCFFAPRHVGILDVHQPLVVSNTNVQLKQARIDCYLQCNAERNIQQIFFKTNGNPYLIAALEWSCRQWMGQSLDIIQIPDYQSLIKALEIPVTQYPLALRVVTVLQDILELMKNKLLEV